MGRVVWAWVGEVVGDADFKDPKSTPRAVTKTAKVVAANAAHLAGLLKYNPFSG